MAITGYTNANPLVVTAPSHGFSDGDTVDISDVWVVDDTENRGKKLSTELVGNGLTIANKTTNTFQLQLNGATLDSTNFPVYYGGGKVRKQVTSLAGLWHLEGQSVVGNSNGDVIGPLTVTNGRITLPNGASRVHVGLPYTATIETLRINVPSSTGETIQGKDKKLSKLSVRTNRCMGMQVGPDENTMRDVKFGLPERFGQPRKLFEGDKETTLKPNWSKEGQFFIKQVEPMPLTVLALIPDILMGGN